MNYLVYEWDKHSYCIEKAVIKEIIDVSRAVETSEKNIKVTMFEDKLLPVLDIVSMLTIKSSEITDKSRIVVFVNNDIEYGILVDEIIGLQMIKSEEIESPGLDEHRFVTGKNKGIRIVDPSILLTDENVKKSNQTRNLNKNTISNGRKILTMINSNSDYLINSIKTEVLNLLLRLDNIEDEKAIEKAHKINEMVEKL